MNYTFKNITEKHTLMILYDYKYIHKRNKRHKLCNCVLVFTYFYINNVFHFTELIFKISRMEIYSGFGIPTIPMHIYIPSGLMHSDIMRPQQPKQYAIQNIKDLTM